MQKTFNVSFIILIVAFLSGCDRAKINQPKNGIYRCGDASALTVLADFDNTNPIISIMGTSFDLMPIKKDAGMKYTQTNEYGQTVIFEVWGDKTTLIIDQGNPESNFYGDCVFIAANPEKDLAVFKAIGHEPEWVNEFDSSKFNFIMLGQSESIQLQDGQFVIPQMNADAIVINPSKGLFIKIEPKSCTDTMSGQAHLYSVQITYKGKTYNGCGFNNADPTQALLPI